MTNYLTYFKNNFNTIITFVFLFIIVYIIIYPKYLSYYFNSALGRMAMVLFIVAVTSINSILGILATVIFIGLNSAMTNYSINSPCSTEGMVIMGGDSNQPQKLIASSSFEPSDMQSNDMILKGDQDVDVSILPPPNSSDSSPVIENFYAPSNFPTQIASNNNLNRKITIENYIRKPRSSNQMPFSKYSESKTEPKPNYMGIGSMYGITPSTI